MQPVEGFLGGQDLLGHRFQEARALFKRQLAVRVEGACRQGAGVFHIFARGLAEALVARLAEQQS